MNTGVEAPAVVAAAPAADAQWYTGADAETVGYITNRGLDKMKPNEAALASIKAHREAEKLLGAGINNLVRLPKDANDVEGRNALFNRIGRPEKAEGYDFTGIEGVDEGFTKFVSPLFHANGVTKEGAREITKALLAEANRAETEAGKATEAQLAVERTDLLAKWGGAADANLVVAQNAFKKLGITEEQSKAIEKVLGFGKTMSLFHDLGTKIGEDPFVNPMGNSGGPARITTKEGALARKKELMADTEWAKRYTAGGSAENKEMTALNTLLAVE